MYLLQIEEDLRETTAQFPAQGDPVVTTVFRVPHVKAAKGFRLSAKNKKKLDRINGCYETLRKTMLDYAASAARPKAAPMRLVIDCTSLQTEGDVLTIATDIHKFAAGREVTLHREDRWSLQDGLPL